MAPSDSVPEAAQSCHQLLGWMISLLDQFPLQRELISGSYRPGAYRLFSIYERKAREIAAAPFSDRVVHHGVMNVIEAPPDRRFIAHSFACRRGRGTRLGLWYRHALHVDWSSPADVKQDFRNASILKHGRVVFNIAGNKYRLVIWTNYA